MPLKRLGFVRRAPEVDAGGFAASWRQDALWTIEQAGGAGPRARVHCVGRDQRDRAAHHGVSIEWFAGEAELAAFDAETASAAPGGARRATIESAPSVLVSERVVAGDDDVIARWCRPPGSHDQLRPVLIGLIERAPHLSRSEFADYWWSQHRPLASALVPAALGPGAYVHNYVLEGQPGQWDGIGELYEDSLDIARLRGEWFDSPAANELIADEERFLVRSTRQVLVCDQEFVSANG
ncbi:MAG TPA: EthD domain-containing protein [Ilumatobacter sp.]|nr:EthD domain-containing protein [Ilumatobacter sp.]